MFLNYSPSAVLQCGIQDLADTIRKDHVNGQRTEQINFEVHLKQAAVNCGHFKDVLGRREKGVKYVLKLIVYYFNAV